MTGEVVFVRISDHQEVDFRSSGNLFIQLNEITSEDLPSVVFLGGISCLLNSLSIPNESSRLTLTLARTRLRESLWLIWRMSFTAKASLMNPRLSTSASSNTDSSHRSLIVAQAELLGRQSSMDIKTRKKGELRLFVVRAMRPVAQTLASSAVAATKSNDSNVSP